MSNFGCFGLLFSIAAILSACTTPKKQQSVEPENPKISLEIPKQENDMPFVQREGYALSFDHKYNLARWVAYSLTREEVDSEENQRENDYSRDPDFPAADASKTFEGYDRGHLAPAEDFEWSAKAMRESFYGANLAPQTSRYNRGIWKRLEGRVRALALREGEVIVVTGPILEPKLKRLENGMAIPLSYYKVLLIKNSKGVKAIGFVIPQDYQSKDLCSYANNIDFAEEVTGVDFFPGLPDQIENQIERTANCSEWMNK